MKQKIKALAGKLRKGMMVKAVALSMALAAFAGPALAAEGDPAPDAVDTVVSSLTTGIQGFADKASGLIGIMIVAAIPIAGALWLARRAFSWFKGMAK